MCQTPCTESTHCYHEYLCLESTHCMLGTVLAERPLCAKSDAERINSVPGLREESTHFRSAQCQRAPVLGSPH